MSLLERARTQWQLGEWRRLIDLVRRVKGGQLTAGSDRRRLHCWLRTFLPPGIALVRFLRQRDLPARYRVVAILVQFRLWGVEMREALRLLVKSPVERR